jgi:hypothetical protein
MEYQNTILSFFFLAKILVSLRRLTIIPPSPPVMPIIKYEVNNSGEWIPWSSKVEVGTHKVATPDIGH